MLLRSKTKRLCLARLAASSAIRELTRGTLLLMLTSSVPLTSVFFCSSLYCSDACRAADSHAQSPAYPPSAGSGAVTKTHYRGDPAREELFYQDIPELDIGGSLAFSTSARRNKSRSRPGKSLSSTAASSQSSSPISAPSFDDEESAIPRSSDLMSTKTAHGVLSPLKHASHGNRTPPLVALEATMSSSLRPVLRYSRRAYSTNVRATAANVKHRRTPSGNLLEMARPSPESAPSSAATSPMLLPYTPTMDTSTIQSRKKNRRSLPLSFATLTVRDMNDSRPSMHGFKDTLAPQFLLNSALASTLVSGGHHHHHKSVITPSHILGGHPSDWHPQLHSKHSKSNSNSNSDHSSGVESGNRTNVDGSSSEGREHVTSTGTIKRPVHLKSKLAGNVKYDGHLGRLISPSAAVTSISTPSVVSVSGSVASTLNGRAPPNADRATIRVPEESHHSPQSPKLQALYNANVDTLKCGRGRSPRRSSSAGTRNINDRIYQPTFSSSSRSSASPVRSPSRGRSRLSTKENEPATTPVNNPNNRLGGPTNQNGSAPSARRASARLQPLTLRTPRRPREKESSRSPSLSTVSSSQSASGSSSACENRPAQPMRVRRKTDGYPQQYVEREYARGRLESKGERHPRGRSRVLPEARLLTIRGDERRGRSLLR